MNADSNSFTKVNFEEKQLLFPQMQIPSDLFFMHYNYNNFKQNPPQSSSSLFLQMSSTLYGQ